MKYVHRLVVAFAYLTLASCTGSPAARPEAIPTPPAPADIEPSTLAPSSRAASTAPERAPLAILDAVADGTLPDDVWFAPNTPLRIPRYLWAAPGDPLDTARLDVLDVCPDTSAQGRDYDR